MTEIAARYLNPDGVPKEVVDGIRNGTVNSDSLRDHAGQILRAVCKDLNTSQKDEERERESKGLAAGPTDASKTAAETHAVLRAQAGFNVNLTPAPFAPAEMTLESF